METVEAFRKYNNETENGVEEHPTEIYSRRKRSIVMPSPSLIANNAYTMEVLVAVDRKMQEYHGSDIKEYVLTLMSIVSSIYADASIGNSINVAVVHILLLQDDLHVESNHLGKLFAFLLYYHTYFLLFTFIYFFHAKRCVCIADALTIL